jgi:hypothetical protein
VCPYVLCVELAPLAHTVPYVGTFAILAAQEGSGNNTTIVPPPPLPAPIPYAVRENTGGMLGSRAGMVTWVPSGEAYTGDGPNSKAYTPRGDARYTCTPRVSAEHTHRKVVGGVDIRG